MKPYHSQQLTRIKNPADLTVVCGVPILPLILGSVTTGPCTILPTSEFRDIVAEALELFRLNSLQKQLFEPQSSADLVLQYLTEWISHCLKLAVQAQPKTCAELETLLVSAASQAEQSLPPQLTPASSERERKICHAYLAQLRTETARRLSGKAWDGKGVSKWWAQYVEEVVTR